MMRWFDVDAALNELTAGPQASSAPARRAAPRGGSESVDDRAALPLAGRWFDPYSEQRPGPGSADWQDELASPTMPSVSDNDRDTRAASAAAPGQREAAVALADSAPFTLEVLLDLTEARAAIREHGAGLPRAEAEAAALAEVAVLAGPLAQSLHAAWEEARLSGGSD